MPIIYLSPSTQDWNMYVTGSGSEEYNMNLLADALVPYLLSNGIRYKRNSPSMTAASSIREANTGWYDLYLALHSNAAPEGRYGEERGIIAFYYPGSTEGRRAAELIAAEDGMEYYRVDGGLEIMQKLAEGMESVGYELESVSNDQLVITPTASQGLFIVIRQAKEDE